MPAKIHRNLIICLLLAPLIATAAESMDMPEEIIVNVPESLRDLRLEINRAQVTMFNVFNELNDDDRFDIHCEYKRRWHSKIREQVCGPVYLKIAQEQEVNLFLKDIGYVGAQGGGPGVTQMDHMNAILEEKMNTIFAEHPEFRRVLNEYTSLEETLKSIRSERFAK